MGEIAGDELSVLLEQLDEVLDDPLLDADDALEVAVLAGLAARLGARGGALARAEAWREEASDLLEEAWLSFDAAALVEAVDGVTGGGADEDEIEEVLLDVDEAVAAAVWCDQRQAVRALAAAVEQTIRQVPEVFAFLAEDGVEMARTRAVAEDPDLYGFWLALADAGRYAE